MIEKDNNFTIVSIGTGTKSIPRSFMNMDGFVLNDCHAEVIARWGFLKYLFSQLELSVTGIESIFKSNKVSQKPFQLLDNVRIHMFISEPPCGDGSLFETDE